MSEAEEGGVPSEEEQQQQHQPDSSSGSPEKSLPAAHTEERSAEGGAAPTQHPALLTDSPLIQFKLRRFFVLRVNTFTFPFVNEKLCAAIDLKFHAATSNFILNSRRRAILILSR